MSKEIWKKIAGKGGNYEGSNRGGVRSLDHIVKSKNGVKRMYPGKTLKPDTRGGYAKVRLGAGKGFLVHRLVLEAFTGPCPKGMECCHWNGVKSDNRAENLRWDTRKNNQGDRKRHGTYICGKDHHKFKITNWIVEFIQGVYKPRHRLYGASPLGEILDLHPSTVGAIARKEYKIARLK